MALDPLGTGHVATAVAALAAGTAVAIVRKGTRWHRWLGRGYCFTMLGLNGTALAIYNLTGRANLFHCFALLSLCTLGVGWSAVIRRRPGWRLRHARTMLWSYVGLLAATASELAVRVPGAFHSWRGFGFVVGAATLMVCGMGALQIRRALARIG